MKGLIFCALTLSLAAPAAHAAAPSSDGQPAQLTVRHSDVDLSTTKGARLMLNRLDEAASAVCGAKSFAAREYKQSLRHTACYQDSMARAVASLDAPTVSALYSARSLTVASK